MTRTQRQGYGLVIVGVFVILLASPSNYHDTLKFQSVQALLLYVSNRRFWIWIVLVMAIQTALIYRLAFRKSSSIPLYATICVNFGTVSITMTKILSMFMHISVNEFHQKSNAPVITHAHRSNAHSPRAIIDSTEEMLSDSIVTASQTSNTHTVLYLILTISTCTLALESFKQQALTLYPVSKFQSTLFAFFNASVILTHVILFEEVSGIWNWIWFWLFFTAGGVIFVRGFQQVHSKGYSRSIT